MNDEVIEHYSDAREVPEDIFQQIYDLNYQFHGNMQSYLTEVPEACNVTVYMDEYGSINAWALYYKEPYPDTRPTFQVWTHEMKRGLGYGVRVAKECLVHFWNGEEIEVYVDPTLNEWSDPNDVRDNEARERLWTKLEEELNVDLVRVY